MLCEVVSKGCSMQEHAQKRQTWASVVRTLWQDCMPTLLVPWGWFTPPPPVGFDSDLLLGSPFSGLLDWMRFPLIHFLWFVVVHYLCGHLIRCLGPSLISKFLKARIKFLFAYFWG